MSTPLTRRRYLEIVAIIIATLSSPPAASSGSTKKTVKNSMFAAGEPSRPSAKKTVVQVSMIEIDGTMTFAPRELRFVRDTDVRFIIRNSTEQTHEIVLGSHTENLAHAQTMKLLTESSHEEPNGRAVPPGATVTLDWRFTKSGSFEFACLLASHADVEIAGTIVVE